ncbi:MAG: STAS/SEC14 domain-containing protein [Bacteroidota bacterium]
MKASIEVKDKVILRLFKGDVYLQDIIDSWDDVFVQFPDLSVYKGVVTDFLEAELHHEDNNMNILIDYLKGYIERMSNMKIAVVMDSPHVTNTIMIGQKMKHVQIRPFTTRQAAIDWINS